MTRRAAPANFDSIARLYRWMEYLSFGRALERCRNHFLPQLAERRSAVVLGDGDGRFLARLLAENSQLQADAIDTSATMLHLLTRRAETDTPGSHIRLHTHQMNALTFTPDHPCDLIVTHFFLDCLTQAELDGLARRLAQHAMPNALWLVSDFRIPDGLMRWPARTLVRSLYFAFGLFAGLRTHALPDHAAALIGAGFQRKAQQLSLAGLLTTELWEQTSRPMLTYNIDSL
jgi:ubiquinone/menaquinone biosynthesis C-methylase UbiE